MGCKKQFVRSQQEEKWMLPTGKHRLMSCIMKNIETDQGDFSKHSLVNPLLLDSLRSSYIKLKDNFPELNRILTTLILYRAYSSFSKH